MRSDLVVISWWSNCLGLACLHGLIEHAPGRRVYVVQCSKPRGQHERFRALLPPGVVELPYPPDAPGEDWRVREKVARAMLGDRAGLWFIDHDLFLQEDASDWLDDMDRRLDERGACLCHAMPRRGPSITNPAFWLAPARLPPGMPGFARLPCRDDPAATRPYAPPGERPPGLAVPEKDTLVAAMEFLDARGLVYGFPVTDGDRVPGGPAPFPRSEHLGGLYTFALGPLPDLFRDWTARCAGAFVAFYEHCPPDWLAVEDPILLSRIESARRAAAAREC